MKSSVKLEGTRRMRVLLPVRFVQDVEALAAAYGIGSYYALSLQVEITCGIVMNDAKARGLFPIELQAFDGLDLRWSTLDIELRQEDALGVMELSHDLGTHPGKIIAALCWHTIRCFLDAAHYAAEQSLSLKAALDKLFPESFADES